MSVFTYVRPSTRVMLFSPPGLTRANRGIYVAVLFYQPDKKTAQFFMWLVKRTAKLGRINKHDQEVLLIGMKFSMWTEVDDGSLTLFCVTQSKVKVTMPRKLEIL